MNNLYKNVKNQNIKTVLYSVSFLCCFLLSFNISAENCTYQFDPQKTLIQGTGYKFSNKKGVTGKFKDIKINQNKKAASIKELLKNLVVTVNLKSLSAGNPLRDKNITETLFSKLVGGAQATVSVKKVTNKNINTQLKINKNSQEVLFRYSIKNNTLTAQGTFNALKYGIGKQIAAFKKRCGSQHKGSDGKKVTWTDFDLKVTAPVIKTCRKNKPI